MINKDDIKTTWDLSKLHESDTANIEGDLQTVKDANYKFINKWKKRKDYLTDPKVLKEALDEYEELNLRYGVDGNVGYYFYLRGKQEQDNTELRAKSSKISDFAVALSNEIDFFTHKIARIKKGKQKEFLEYPGLSEYKHFLEQLFDSAKYLLSEKEEKILTLTSKSAYSNWVKMVSTALSKETAEVLDEDGTELTKTFPEIAKIMNSPKKNVRDRAAKEFNKIIAKHVFTAENELNAILEYKKVNDELRKMKRPDLASLIGDDIEPKIVDTLVKCVAKRYKISRDFYKLKARLLGVNKLAYHERNVTYGEIKSNYDYENSVNLVHETFSELDIEFGNLFEEFVKNGHIDVYPKKGKANGAFCVNQLNTQPTYILLNHTNELNEVLTIAHEMGHAINAELIKKKQKALNSGTSLAVAEVASTFMEDFVLQKLMQNTDDEEQLALVMMKLNADISTIQKQVACFNFEHELHRSYREKGYLSSDVIGEIFAKHMQDYMGDFVEQDDDSRNWWVYWSHIRSYFYTYSYANGLLISKALQNKVHADPKFIEKIKVFLSAGTSKSPREIFLDLGVDITSRDFWNEGLDEIDNLLKKAYVLATKLHKI